MTSEPKYAEAEQGVSADGWSLPALQEWLDGMEPGQSLSLTSKEGFTLFGDHQEDVGPIANFAEGHRCQVSYRPGWMTFRKLR